MKSPLKDRKIHFSTKSELVYETLKEQITTGQLKPGTRLSASEVALVLGVSRTPVNDAVRILAVQGLVRMLPNIGFEIRAFSWDEIKEVMHIRLELEKLAVSWVIKRADDEQLAELCRLSQAMRQAILDQDKERYYQTNASFHHTLYQAAQAPRLLDLHLRIWDYEGWYGARMKGMPERLLLLCDDHDRVIEAMCRRDAAIALEILKSHVQNCIQVLSENLQALGYLHS